MSTSLQAETSFSIRRCGFCGSDKRELLFDLEPDQFCSPNWTYRASYASKLGISSRMRFPVDRCSMCGFIYARLLPSPAFLTQVYEAVIDPELCRRGSENRESYARRMGYIAVLLMLAPEKGTLKALDFGCGIGVSLRLLKSAGVDVVGFDPSLVRVEGASKRGYSITQDETELIKLGPYDMLICDNVLEHLPEPAETLGLLSSVSAPGSVLYVSVPSYEKDFIKDQLNSSKNGLPLDMTLNPWEHLNYFDLDHLDRLAGRFGFRPISAPEIPGHVDIGLRSERGLIDRIKNSLASLPRMARYAVLGRACRSSTNAAYRFTGDFA